MKTAEEMRVISVEKYRESSKVMLSEIEKKIEQAASIGACVVRYELGCNELTVEDKGKLIHLGYTIKIIQGKTFKYYDISW